MTPGPSPARQVTHASRLRSTRRCQASRPIHARRGMRRGPTPWQQGAAAWPAAPAPVPQQKEAPPARHWGRPQRPGTGLAPRRAALQLPGTRRGGACRAGPAHRQGQRRASGPAPQVLRLRSCMPAASWCTGQRSTRAASTHTHTA
jgi:hypothetical protein